MRDSESVRCLDGETVKVDGRILCAMLTEGGSEML